LNAFTSDYYDLKTEVFYSYLQHYGTNQAMWRKCSNLGDCLIVLLWIAFSENIITSHWPLL